MIIAMPLEKGMLSEEEPESLELHWNVAFRAWTVRTPTETIEISEQVHEEAMQAYLKSVGIEKKTYSQYMRSAEEAWIMQCKAERQLHQALDFWKQLPEAYVRPIRNSSDES